jgi:hypothetical protein
MRRRVLKLRRLFLSILIGLLLLISACQASPTSGVFTSNDGGFSVNSAGRFKATKQQSNSSAGKLVTYQFTAEMDKRTDIVSYTDYPADFISQNDPEDILDGASISAIAVLNGHFVSATKISLDNYPGREILATAQPSETQSLLIKGRLFLVKNRLYMVLVAADNGQVSNDDLDAFLSSFKFISP